MNESTLSQSPPAFAAAGSSNAPARGRRRVGRAATVVAATLLPLAIWVVAVPVVGLDLTVGTGSSAQTVGATSVVVAGLVAGAGAWAVLAVLERWAPGPARRTFATVGWPLLLLSCAGPVLAGGSGIVLATLIAMHVATGTALILGLSRPAGRSA